MRFIVLLTLLSACGSQGGGSGSDNSPEITAQGAPSPEQQQQVDTQYAQLVQDAASLPACDATTEGKLVYVKASSEFEVCGGGAWAVIDLKGIAGTAGIAGEKGDKGDKGDKGEAGKDAETLSANEWIDPVTALYWFKAGDGDWATAQLACDGDYRLPTEAELIAGALHGIRAATGGHTDAWTSAPDTGNTWNYTVTGIGSNPSQGTKAKTDAIGVYCVRAE